MVVAGTPERADGQTLREKGWGPATGREGREGTRGAAKMTVAGTRSSRRPTVGTVDAAGGGGGGGRAPDARWHPSAVPLPCGCGCAFRKLVARAGAHPQPRATAGAGQTPPPPPQKVWPPVAPACHGHMLPDSIATRDAEGPAHRPRRAPPPVSIGSGGEAGGGGCVLWERRGSRPRPTEHALQHPAAAGCPAAGGRRARAATRRRDLTRTRRRPTLCRKVPDGRPPKSGGAPPPRGGAPRPGGSTSPTRGGGAPRARGARGWTRRRLR